MGIIQNKLPNNKMNLMHGKQLILYKTYNLNNNYKINKLISKRLLIEIYIDNQSQ